MIEIEKKTTRLVLNNNNSLSLSLFYLYRLNYSTRLGMVLLNHLTKHAKLSLVFYADLVVSSLCCLIYSNLALS